MGTEHSRRSKQDWMENALNAALTKHESVDKKALLAECSYIFHCEIRYARDILNVLVRSGRFKEVKGEVFKK